MPHELTDGPAEPGGTAAPTAPLPGTDEYVRLRVRQRAHIVDEVGRRALTGEFGEVQVGFDVANGRPIMGQSPDSKQMAALHIAMESIDSELASLSGPAGVTASVAAQIGQQDRQLAEASRQFGEKQAEVRAKAVEDARQFDVAAARGQSVLAETERSNKEDEQRARAAQAETGRANNLRSTLDLLENQIRVGTLATTEASNRITAATKAADVQRAILADWGGKNIPAGSQYYPNLGPSGAIAAAMQALGMPFGGVETGGTFAIDPNAIAAPITAAVGGSALPGANDALARAQAALAGLGVPATPAGRAQRDPQISAQAVARALAGG